MSAETLAENHIRQNHTWQKLPANVKQSFNSQREYEKAVVTFSIKNQLRYKGNLVKAVRKDEPRYYEELLQYSRDHLMLYPYHLSDIMVKGLRATPFSYYSSMMQDIMAQERSYDSLPNFTAADCLRLLGIGRNQYIELMNQCRSSKKFFRKRPVKELLPTQPIEGVAIEPWWMVQVGFVTEDDIRLCNDNEKKVIDTLIDTGAQVSGELNKAVIHGLYRRGLVYLDAPILDEDTISVPPLEGFVMNRVLGDYFETLLYKIFVSMDEHTSVCELANVLQIDLSLVKNAISMYCRLGFAKKKSFDLDLHDLHPSWSESDSSGGGATGRREAKPGLEHQLLIDLSSSVTLDAGEVTRSGVSRSASGSEVKDEVVQGLVQALDQGPQTAMKRIAFLFDSTLTAFLMMGNLSQGLKSHAVTMFEVGKLSDESMDSFLSELEKVVGSDAEGEARRYFDHAMTLRDTVLFLRHNPSLTSEVEGQPVPQGQGVDLLRCESLLGLDPSTRSRVLNKNYSLLVSMAPLSKEIRPVSSTVPRHIGPAIPEVSSIWFKLFLYHLTSCGPPSLLLVKGTKLHRLPKALRRFDRLLVTTWGHDPGVIASSNILLTLNDALTHSAVLVQGHGRQAEGMVVHVPFPLDTADGSFPSGSHVHHPVINQLATLLDLRHSCGYVSLLNPLKEEPLEDELDGDPFVAPTFVARPQPHGDANANKHSDAGTSASPGNSSDSVFSPIGNTADSAAGAIEEDEPQNGIKDQISAAMLASELDSLDQGDVTLKEVRDSLVLDVAAPDVGAEEGAAVPRSGSPLRQEEWLLLDLCWGLPLFDTQLNMDVCGRIKEHGLFQDESLQELTTSSRRLSLQLLEFIMGWQVQSVVSEVDAGGVPQAKDEHCSLFPSQNILFDGATVGLWNGH